MPSYAFLAERGLDTQHIAEHLQANRAVGVPYTEEMIKDAKADELAQLDPDGDTSGVLKRYPGAAVFKSVNGTPAKATEMDALLAYLQVLGTEVKFRDVDPVDLAQ